MDKVSVTALSATIDETGPFQLGNKFSYFGRHPDALSFMALVMDLCLFPSTCLSNAEEFPDAAHALL